MVDLMLIKRIAINLVLLVAIAFSIWFGTLWIATSVLAGPHGRWYEALPFYLIVIGLPLVIGGIVQQGVLLILPRGWSNRQMRVAALVSTVAIPLVFLLFRPEPEFLFSLNFLPLLAGVFIYGAIMRPPRRAA